MAPSSNRSGLRPQLWRLATFEHGSDPIHLIDPLRSDDRGRAGTIAAPRFRVADHVMHNPSTMQNLGGRPRATVTTPHAGNGLVRFIKLLFHELLHDNLI